MTEPRVLGDVEIVPGKLWVRVMLHELMAWEGPISCWTYVTGGMLALNHPELVFTLARDDRETENTVPTAPLQLLDRAYQQVAGGQPLRAGDAVDLGEARLFGHHAVVANAQIFPDVELPLDALALVLVTPDELRAAREHGATRVLARLGQATAFYPFPPWADRRRRGLSLRDTFEASVLGQTPRATVAQLRVTGRDEQIQLVGARAALPMLQPLGQVPEASAFALLTGLDPRADACLVWEPGQPRAAAVARPDSQGAKIAGCFVMFLPGQLTDGGLLLEDGYAMKLTTASWQAVRRALLDGTDLTIPATDGGKPFVLIWRDEPHVIPIVGIACEDMHGWGPAAEGAPEASATDVAVAAIARGKVRIAATRLLTPEDDFGARSSPREFATFCREIQRCAERVIGPRSGAVALTIRVRSTLLGHELELGQRGDAPPQVLEQLHAAIRELAPLPVREADVRFEIDLIKPATATS